MTDKQADGLYSLEEVKKHNTGKDLWIVLWNHVYDVTEYQEDHPGGKEFLLENAGTDATTAYEDIGHSTDAREIVENMRIGKLNDADWTDHSTKKVPEVTPSGVHVVNNLPAPTHHHHHTGVISVGLLSMILTIVLGRRYSSILHRLQRAGFWRGFAVFSFASIILALVTGGYAAKNLSIAHQDFQSYPAHKKSKSKSRPAVTKPINLGVLNARDYQPFPLIAKFKLSRNTYRFVFGLPSKNSVLGLPTGQHIAIRHEVNGRQIARSYTPTSSNKDRGRLELTVKIYPDGALTPYLESLNIGDNVDIRGPKGEMKVGSDDLASAKPCLTCANIHEMKYHKNLTKEFGMIAGGTGITPMFQIIRRICHDPRDDTRMTLLYANKTEDDILLRDELEGLAKDHSDQFQLCHVLSNSPDGWTQGKERVDKDLIKQWLPGPNGQDSKILVCGPDAMANAMRQTLIDMGFKKPDRIAHPKDEVFVF